MFAGAYYDYVRLFRVVWYSGRYGGGKTLLAVGTAKWLLDHGYCSQIASNIPLSIPGMDLVQSCDVRALRELQDTAVVYDEAWLDLQAGADRKVLSDWLGFVRHRNQFLLFPSVISIKKQMSFLRVGRLLNLLPLGLDLWFYQYDLSNGAIKDRGRFAFRPRAWFGTYDSQPKKVEKDIFYVYKEGEEVGSGK